MYFIFFFGILAALFVSFKQSIRSIDLNTLSIETASDLVVVTKDWIVDMTTPCRYVENPVEALNSSLHQHIKGQSEGIETILNAFSDWEFRKSSGVHEPLVLAITGPTGVGKSETAFRLGQALYSKITHIGNKAMPCGLLILRGEDYSVDSEVASKGMSEIHKTIRAQIIEHISQCDGHAVIVFDEVQKVAPGTLEVLMPALEERGSLTETSYSHSVLNYLTQFATGKQDIHAKPSVRSVSTAQSVFLFISDIGAELMTKLLLVYGNRNQIPLTTLRNEVKLSLDEQWDRLKFGKNIKAVVPFLPLEPVHLKEILMDRITTLNTASKYVKWSNLIVSDSVVELMITPPNVKYSYHTMKNSNGNNGNSEQQCDKNDRDCDVTAPTSTESSGSNSKTKIFATWGARSLENAGPLQDLRSMIQRYAQPWRPDQILHIGLTKDTPQSAKWKPFANANGAEGGNGNLNQIYFQWCKAATLNICSPTDPQCIDNMDITTSAANNNKWSDKLLEGKDFDCETAWFGVFPC